MASKEPMTEICSMFLLAERQSGGASDVAMKEIERRIVRRDIDGDGETRYICGPSDCTIRMLGASVINPSNCSHVIDGMGIPEVFVTPEFDVSKIQ